MAFDLKAEAENIAAAYAPMAEHDLARTTEGLGRAITAFGERVRSAARAAGKAEGEATNAIWRDNMQNAWAALRMIREALEEFSPAVCLPSEEAVLLRGPEPIHEAEALVEAILKLKAVGKAEGESETVAAFKRQFAKLRAATDDVSDEALIAAARAEALEAAAKAVDDMPLPDDAPPHVRTPTGKYQYGGKTREKASATIRALLQPPASPAPEGGT